ncbi:hypothetical protein [Streptomyces sp. NPDC053726]|uniref:hypothetical protein n=1 Tax=Streptomyces sp. NPDC053726 TaxID=3365713 RepID=UPI0037D8CA69
MTGRRIMCGATLHLTTHTKEDVRTAATLSRGAGVPELIYPTLRCTVETHPEDSAHWALASDLRLRSPGDIWATWTDHHQPHALIEAGYCTATGGADGVCLIIDGHHGGHSWELATPAGTTLRALTGPYHQRPAVTPTLVRARVPRQPTAPGGQR